MGADSVQIQLCQLGRLMNSTDRQVPAGQASNCGRTVRVKLDEQNRRIFTLIPYAKLGWLTRYNARSSLEWIFSPFDQGDRFEHYYIRGHKNMKARAVLVAAAMMGYGARTCSQRTTIADAFI